MNGLNHLIITFENQIYVEKYHFFNPFKTKLVCLELN